MLHWTGRIRTPRFTALFFSGLQLVPAMQMPEDCHVNAAGSVVLWPRISQPLASFRGTHIPDPSSFHASAWECMQLQYAGKAFSIRSVSNALPALSILSLAASFLPAKTVGGLFSFLDPSSCFAMAGLVPSEMEHRQGPPIPCLSAPFLFPALGFFPSA